MWIDFLDRLHAGTEAAAHDAIASMTADDVLHFWAWNDRSAAEFIREAREAGDTTELADIAASLRESLARDVLDEIAYRARNKAGV